MADSAQDKTLPATPRKIQKSRKEGQVPRSRELGHLLAFVAGGAVLIGLARQITDWLVALLGQGLRFNVSAVQDPRRMTELLFDQSWQLMAFVAPLGVLMVVMAIAAGTLTGGWNFSLKAMQPKLQKLDPIAGIGRMFSKAQFGPMLKSCLLALVLFATAAAYLHSHMDDFTHLMGLPLSTALGEAGRILLGGLIVAMLVVGVFALVDVPLQRWLTAEQMKMSHQEVKQENKEVEGNAEVKGKMRAMMRANAQRRMLTAVPGADIVVMNPTHFAVALKYDEGGSGAPRVVAKGADLLAFRIREAATEAGVPVLQAPPLARALYTHCEIDQEIPGPLFAAVAQVLAWVFQLRAALATGSALPGAPAAINVPPELDPINKIRRRRPRGADT
jgi:flagellar biosynthetic protein FlhB